MIKKVQQIIQRRFNQYKISMYSKQLTETPLNAERHLRLAVSASKTGHHYLAYAEIKTAEFLYKDTAKLQKETAEFRKALPQPLNMNHNQYYRFMSLSQEIMRLCNKDELSILDVGGGQGQLVSFLPPNVAYCLAEPTINGISGTHLPFQDNSFDYVVSCHVLEHIPNDERTLFLDQLLSKAKKGVILLNPFYVENSHTTERLKLIIDITGEEWAKEHLECELPTIESIKSFANDRGLLCTVKPNGSLVASVAFVFLDHFVTKSGCWDDWKKINAFFNDKYASIMDSSEYPNSYIVYLGKN